MFPCHCYLLTLVRCPYVILATMLIAFTSAIPIPNGQIGKAEVECGENTIEVVFLTEQVFQGRVYVVGHANEPECQSRDTGRRTTSIIIPKDKCSVVTTRSTNPPGLFVNVKVMISFHEAFITKVDRGYEISCFYMEADKTVTYPLTVSMRSLEPFTELAEMPRCRYEVVDPQTMDPVTVVSVGNKLLHKWTCDSTAPSLWCMTVHSCAVEDGSGTQFVILNDNGCSVDKYLLGNLEYGPGDLAAQKEAHAFKFADRVVVNFQCSIRLDIRDGQCPRPQCTETRRTRRLFSRSAGMSPSEQLTIGDPESITTTTSAVADIDVRAQQIDVLDPKIDFGLNVNDERLRSAIERAAQSVRPDVMRINNGFRHCVPFSLFVVSGGLCAALSASLIIVASTLCRHTTRKL